MRITIGNHRATGQLDFQRGMRADHLATRLLHLTNQLTVVRRRTGAIRRIDDDQGVGEPRREQVAIVKLIVGNLPVGQLLDDGCEKIEGILTDMG